MVAEEMVAATEAAAVTVAAVAVTAVGVVVHIAAVAARTAADLPLTAIANSFANCKARPETSGRAFRFGAHAFPHRPVLRALTTLSSSKC